MAFPKAFDAARVPEGEQFNGYDTIFRNQIFA